MKPIILPAEMSEDSPPVCVSKSPAKLGFASYWELCNTTGGWDAGLCPTIESNCSKYLQVWWFRPDLLLCAFIFLYSPFSFFYFLPALHGCPALKAKVVQLVCVGFEHLDVSCSSVQFGLDILFSP